MRSILPATGQNLYTPGGGGGSGPPPTSLVQKGSVPLVATQQSYAVVFSPAFATPPTSFLSEVQMPNSSGEVFEANADLSTLTVNGVTVWLSGIPSAASAGGQLNWRAEL